MPHPWTKYLSFREKIIRPISFTLQSEFIKQNSLHPSLFAIWGSLPAFIGDVMLLYLEWRAALGHNLHLPGWSMTFSCLPCCQGLALKPWGRFCSFFTGGLISLTWAGNQKFNNLEPISCPWQPFLIYTIATWLPWKPMAWPIFYIGPPPPYQIWGLSVH